MRRRSRAAFDTTDEEARGHLEQGAHGASLMFLVGCPSCFVAADHKDD